MSDTGVKGDYYSNNAALSADGSTVAFDSIAINLDPADSDSSVDVYVKDLVTGDIVLASASDSGVAGNSFSDRPFLSADGGTVAFGSQWTNLSPADTDTLSDIYVKDLRRLRQRSRRR